MNKLMMNKKGFTLMEVLIVVIVLGVLAGLAVPIFTRTTAKAEKAEALTVLTAIRGSMMRYFIERGEGDYTGAVGATAAVSNTDFDWGAGSQNVGGQQAKFTYGVAVEGADEDQYTATATLISDTNSTVTIDETGCISGTALFAAPACP